MKQYTGWQALYLSFYSTDLYRDVAKNWQGVGYLYLLLVVCLTALFICVQVQVVAVPKAKDVIDTIINQAPSIKIDKGKLSIDKPSPFVIKEPKSGQTLITFDTSDRPMTLAESKSVVLVTSKQIVTVKRTAMSRDTGGGASSVPIAEETYDLSTVDHFDFDKTQVESTIHSFLNWLGALMFLILVPFGFLFCVIQTLIYALIGKIFTSVMAVDLSYPTLIRLTAVCLTPVLLADSILKVSGTNLPLWWLCAIVIALGYLGYAVFANSQTTPGPATTGR